MHGSEQTLDDKEYNVRVGDGIIEESWNALLRGELGRLSAGLSPVGDDGLCGCGDSRSGGDFVTGECSGP